MLSKGGESKQVKEDPGDIKTEDTQEKEAPQPLSAEEESQEATDNEVVASQEEVRIGEREARIEGLPQLPTVVEEEQEDKGKTERGKMERWHI